ncbi:Putative multidrug resistance protein MdtD [Streptomyces glaucescens]
MTNTQSVGGTAVDRAANPGLTLAAVAVVQFMVSLDLSVVNVGLPEIASGLGFSDAGLTWVIHAYALTFGGLLLLGGKIADRYGHKRILLIGLPVFGLASLIGGFAQEPGHLVAARAVQGVGAATLAPAALALLTSTFPSGKARVKAFGVWSAMNAAGGALGVLIGGVLTEYAGWEWVMFVNVPMAAVALALAWRGVAADPPARRRGRPDVLGAVLATAGMTLLVFGVVRTDQHAWGSSVTLASAAIASAHRWFRPQHAADHGGVTGGSSRVAACGDAPSPAPTGASRPPRRRDGLRLLRRLPLTAGASWDGPRHARPPGRGTSKPGGIAGP